MWYCYFYFPGKLLWTAFDLINNKQCDVRSLHYIILEMCNFKMQHPTLLSFIEYIFYFWSLYSDKLAGDWITEYSLELGTGLVVIFGIFESFMVQYNT